MITLVLVTFVDLFVFIFNLLLVIRVVMSYFAHPEWRIWQLLVDLTEPLLAPVRSILPNLSGVDLSPIATFFLLQGIEALIHHLTGV